MKSVLIILALFDLSVSAAPQGARAPVVAGAIQAGARAAAQRYQNEPDPSTMATYYFGLLRRGPQWTPERSAETERIQREHMANIRRLAEMGKLIAAGPFADGGDLRGVFIFQAGSAEEARRLVDTDPAVQAGRLACEIHRWYGSKGIGSKYAAWKKENPQAQDKMVTYQLGLLRRGPQSAPADAEETRRLHQDHLAHIRSLMQSGKLGAAGPFTDDGELRGLLIFRAASLDEARALAEADPLVKSGRLVVEFHPWMAADGTLP